MTPAEIRSQGSIVHEIARLKKFKAYLPDGTGITIIGQPHGFKYEKGRQIENITPGNAIQLSDGLIAVATGSPEKSRGE